MKLQYSMNLRKFQLSCKYFSGFSCYIDLDNHNNMETVILEIKTKLKTVLNENNLSVLLQFLKNTNYHYHNYTFSDTLKYTQHTFYVCNHCDEFELKI